MPHIEDGATAYAVTLWGDNGDDPSYRMEGAGTWSDAKTAKNVARESLRVQNANEREDIRWSALVEEGHREGFTDPDSGLYIEGYNWEPHDDGERWWFFQAEDGRIVEDGR